MLGGEPWGRAEQRGVEDLQIALDSAHRRAALQPAAPHPRRTSCNEERLCQELGATRFSVCAPAIRPLSEPVYWMDS